MRALTPKQRRFAEEYSVDCNASQAAIRAGYSARTADKIGTQLLGKTSIGEMVNELLLAKAERCQVSAEWVVKSLQEVVDRCMKPKEIRDSQGKPTGVYKFDSKGACRALELIGKHIGMFRREAGPQSHFHVHAGGPPVHDGLRPAPTGPMLLPGIVEVVVNRPL